MRAALLSLLVIVLDVSAASSEPAQIKWGEIQRDNFLTTEEIGDANASAVILADIGRVTFSGEFNVTFERHRRILLVNESAYDEWGTVEIPYYAEDSHQKVSHIDGITYRASSGGPAERFALDKKSVFVEDVLDGRFKSVRFTMPGLSPGCIIEYRYTLTSDNPTFLQEWDFQTSEPTLWSEFSAEIPVLLNYKIAIQGVTHFDVDESKEGQWPIDLAYGQMAQLNGLGTTTRRFAISNVPALREEPYITTLDDYRARLRFQLSDYQFPGMAPQTFLPTWPELARELLEDHDVGANFGRRLGKREVERTAKTLTEGLRDPEEKLRAIYDYVRTTMVWDETYTPYAHRPLADLIESKSGNSGEIALLLTDLLQFSGVEAHPALLSARNHGSIVQAYPIVTQFNTTMTYVKIGGREWLLDATDRHRPMNLLPIDALNGPVWVVKDDPKWLTIARTGLRQREIVVSATLSPDGSISGNLRAMHAGYSALEERHRLDALSSREEQEKWLREEWLGGMEEVAIDSIEIGNQHSITAPLAVICSFTVAGQDDSDKIGTWFVPAVWAKPLGQNPFKSTVRSLPIDFACGSDRTYTLRLTIPDGFTVESMPEPISHELPGGDARFDQTATMSGSQLELTSHFTIDRTIYGTEEYAALRALFEAAVDGHAQQLAIARIPATPATNAVTTK